MRKLRLAALAIALLFLAACAAPALIYNNDEFTTEYTTTEAEIFTTRYIATDEITVFVGGGRYRDNELWLRNEHTGEETLLFTAGDWKSLNVGGQLNERFFVFGEFWLTGSTIMFYDLDERRVIHVHSAGQAHPSCIRFHGVNNGRVYLNMGHGGVRWFDMAQLESGQTIVIPCDMPPMHLVTGELADVREITVMLLEAPETTITLSAAQRAQLFTALRNVEVRVVMHPRHHSYMVWQGDREFRVQVRYADGSVDVIIVEPDAFRMLYVPGYGYRAFVIGTEVDALVHLIESFV